MRIAVVSSLEAGVEKAYAINTVNMAQGFAKWGHEVTLITFADRTQKKSDAELKTIYDIRESVRWIQLPRLFFNQLISPDMPFALMALGHLLRLRPDFVFVRSYIAPNISARWGFATVAESHAHTDNRTTPFLKMIDGVTQYEKFRYLITISNVLSNHYQTLGVPAEKMLVLPTGVDIDRFSRPDQLPPSPYPDDKPNVVYVGHLYDYKGIPTILDTAKLMPDLQFHLIGGLPHDIDKVKETIQTKGINNISLHGFKAQSEIPTYLWHADILLLPPSDNHPSARWTSPVKLGEYLASGTPVIATQIPALEDWLSDDEVTFVTPDSAQAMVEGIRQILTNADTTQAKVTQGLKLARTFSYRQRAKTILEKCGF